MITDKERIKYLQQTIDDLQNENEKLTEDIEVALIAMGKMEDALKHLKTKKWWKL